MTFRTLIILLIWLILKATNGISQDIFWVVEGDTGKMYNKYGNWMFKDSLPDGHYCSYKSNNKKYISREIIFKNGKKEGIENNYFSDSKEKLSTISWLNGKKNGIETHYNFNGTIDYQLTFKENELNGFCEVNWPDGKKSYNGFYKNGFRDSIWTYYDHTKNNSDTTDSTISEQYRYKNGKLFLISAWDKQGKQNVINGNGILIDNHYSLKITTYLNGMKDGRQIVMKNDGNIMYEFVYKEDLIIKETFYYDSNKVSSISEWKYLSPPNVDTMRQIFDSDIGGIYYNEISYCNTRIENGLWVAYYPNGIKNYEGNYIDGARVGVWNWAFPNGKQRITADFTKNKWQHYDTTGNIISNFNNEFLTYLTEYRWELNQKLDSAIVIFTSIRCPLKILSNRIIFHYNGQLEINKVAENRFNLEESMNYYNLQADTLILCIKDKQTNESKIYKYKIISATESQITMKRIY